MDFSWITLGRMQYVSECPWLVARKAIEAWTDLNAAPMINLSYLFARVAVRSMRLKVVMARMAGSLVP